jgi:hypothetical protein
MSAMIGGNACESPFHGTQTANVSMGNRRSLWSNSDALRIHIWKKRLNVFRIDSAKKNHGMAMRIKARCVIVVHHQSTFN